MVKEQIPAFIFDSGARTGATRMTLTPCEGYVLSSHNPLEEQDPSWLLAIHGHFHFQRLDHVVPASADQHTCTAFSLDRSSPPTCLRKFLVPVTVLPVPPVCTAAQ